MAFLFPFCNGELLFVNTRLSVKVKLSVFNLVKAIQSCREEVKISSKTDVNFLNATLVLTVIMLSKKNSRDKRGRRGEGEGIGKMLESERLLFVNCSFSRHNNFWQCFVAKGQCIWRAGTF